MKGGGKTNREERDDQKNEGGGAKGQPSSSRSLQARLRHCLSSTSCFVVAMGGHDDDGGKSDDSWSFYTAQAQSMGQKALSSTDEVIKTARVQINQLQDASSHHYAAAQVRKQTVDCYPLFSAVQNPSWCIVDDRRVSGIQFSSRPVAAIILYRRSTI